MASNRHLGRIVALQTLYEYEFRKDAGDKNLNYKDILERNLAEYKSSIDDVIDAFRRIQHRFINCAYYT